MDNPWRSAGVSAIFKSNGQLDLTATRATSSPPRYRQIIKQALNSPALRDKIPHFPALFVLLGPAKPYGAAAILRSRLSLT